MKVSQEFKFLKIQSLQRKDNTGYFYIINLLDLDNNPVRLYSFDNDVNNQLTKDINEGKLKSLQNILLDLDLTQNDKGWNVKLGNYSLKY